MKITLLDLIMYICIPLYLYSLLGSSNNNFWSLLASICLPSIICGCIYFYYKKLNQKLESIEKLLKCKDNTAAESSSKNQTPKD